MVNLGFTHFVVCHDACSDCKTCENSDKRLVRLMRIPRGFPPAAPHGV